MSRDTSDPEKSQRAQIVLVIEFGVLLIALLMPITPSKTGSTWTPAALIWPEPSYFQEVGVWFVLTHVLLALLGLAAWLLAKFSPDKH